MFFRSTVISEAEGYVQNISWSKQFVAWASDIGVRVYDVENKCSLGLMQWTKNPAALPSNYRCNMSWLNDTTLLVYLISNSAFKINYIYWIMYLIFCLPSRLVGLMLSEYAVLDTDIPLIEYLMSIKKIFQCSWWS